ncbi:hypothetical protein HPB51_013455 [Rhipicephalus microplus]|uniref:ditrans,polycis-polyprenyl diphosphate synthase [(2E,6E)-farnesyldiphosphate specific] n=1 Tax=Rhipicephalus microplus TaxID=6941 RepID=A0A9J6EA32_RHIMP|nr:hypothetical protein HPB51_013455 [Rhipicephalus microplus]
MGLEGAEVRAWVEERESRAREERAAERDARKEKMEQMELERRLQEEYQKTIQTKKLRLCIAYSSKFDLKNMVSDFANAVKADVIESDDICPCLVTEWLALNEASETELWFRSSGERRFSEFLVLQSGYAYMHREAELWPAVSIWHWVRAIVQFQLNWPHIKAVKENHRTQRTSACDHKDLEKSHS